jgi:hypothetical protein
MTERKYFIGLLLFEYSLGKKPASYFRKKAKENQELNKKLSELYRTIESRPGESFTQFKKRYKNTLGTKS